MAYAKKAGYEPLPGYRLIEPLGQGGFGEVWKCEVPGGLFKAIKFVHGNLDGLDPDQTAQREFDALEHVKSIRHPFVLSLERAEVIDGELVIVMELADKNLEDRLRECQAEGLPGIPREELLALLADAAEALDLLNQKFGLQHLDIKPSNLFVISNHVKLADFGLVQSLKELTPEGTGLLQLGMTPLYSPPEMLQGSMSPHCDQYSLAIVYQQLLTGTLPFEGKNSRQLMMKHLTEPPNLEPLSESDRPVVARALAKEPEQRFSCCQEFIQGLIWSEGVSTAPSTRLKKSSRLLRPPSVPADSAKPAAAHAPTPAKEYFALRSLRDTKAHHNSLTTTPTAQIAPFRGTDRRYKPALDHHEATPHPAIQVAGYEFIECLQTSYLGDLWKICSSDGQLLMVRFLPDNDLIREKFGHFEEAMNELKHPCLAQQEASEQEGRWLLLTEYCGLTLYERFRQCAAEGLPGISRLELLGYIGRIARLLDERIQQFDMPHLHLHPHAILLEKKEVVLTEMGLAAFLWDVLEQPPLRLNARYAAPEVLAGAVASTSDQYSLALIYTEVLTGFHPRPKPPSGKSRNLKVDLTLLPTSDESTLARALHPDPSKRFATCCEFVEALGVRYRSASSRSMGKELPKLLPLSQLHKPAGAAATTADAHKYFTDYFSKATGELTLHTLGSCTYSRRGNSNLESHVPIRFPTTMLRGTLQEFADRWHARLENPDTNVYRFRFRHKGSLWNLLTASESGLEIHLKVKPYPRLPNILAGAAITISIYGHANAALACQLDTLGPELLSSLLSHLQSVRERRRHIRVPLTQSLQFFPVLEDQTVGNGIEAESKDISLNSISFTTAHQPLTKRIYVQLESAAEAEDPFVVLLYVKRTQALENGLIEVGAVLDENSNDATESTDSLPEDSLAEVN